MSTELLKDVIRFSSAAGDAHLLMDRESLFALRRALCEEESNELANGFGYVAPQWIRDKGIPVDIVEIADACCDLAYVALGTLYTMFGEACAQAMWDEVHRSNMDKFPGGRVLYKPNGKIAKPDGWRPPDLASVLRKHGFAV